MDRRQLPQETFEDFYNAILRLRNQQRTPYGKRDLVEIMRSNLNPSLSQLLFSLRIEGLNEFCKHAKKADNLLANQRQQYIQRQFVTQRVHEITYDEEEVGVTDLEVDTISPTTRYTCWNCKQGGHSFMDCLSPNRRIFCFKCGRDGVVTPKYPKCQGNQQLNPSPTGQTRSTQT